MKKNILKKILMDIILPFVITLAICVATFFCASGITKIISNLKGHEPDLYDYSMTKMYIVDEKFSFLVHDGYQTEDENTNYTEIVRENSYTVPDTIYATCDETNFSHEDIKKYFEEVFESEEGLKVLNIEEITIKDKKAFKFTYERKDLKNHIKGDDYIFVNKGFLYEISYEYEKTRYEAYSNKDFELLNKSLAVE